MQYNSDLFYKPLKDLSDKEWYSLFVYKKKLHLEDFFREYGKYSIATFPHVLPNDDTNPTEAWFFAAVMVLKTRIPENKLIAIYGDPVAGKSFIINLVKELQNKTLNEIEKRLKVDSYNASRIKNLVDQMQVVPKKTTRPAREKNNTKNEIVEGVSREEIISSCDITYEKFGALYGFSTEDISKALQKGHVLIIVTDYEALNKLKNKFPVTFTPTVVARDKDDGKGKWEQLMLQASRSEKEISQRASHFGESDLLTNDIFWHLRFPDVIINDERK